MGPFHKCWKLYGFPLVLYLKQDAVVYTEMWCCSHKCTASSVMSVTTEVLVKLVNLLTLTNKLFWALFIFFDSLSNNVTCKRSYQSQNLNSFDKGQVIFDCLHVTNKPF